jgi:dTDP-4-dehydrorhamnose reductase
MTVLILGVSGMLGHKLFQLLGAAGHDVAGTMRDDRAASALAGIPLFAGTNVVWAVDAMNWAQLRSLLESRRPDVVVNALGIIKQRPEASSATPAIQINALLPHQIADSIARWNGRLIHFSTDCVFSGRRGNYLEADASDAEDLYGKTKFLGEVAQAPNAVTLRSSIIGRELQRHRSLLDWVLSQNHRRVQGYSRVIYSGLTTIEMAAVVDRIIRRHPGLHGLYHVASEPISKDALLRLLIDAYQLDIDVTSVDTPVSDRSLNGDRFSAETGYVAPPWPELVRALASDPTPYTDWVSLMANPSAS